MSIEIKNPEPELGWLWAFVWLRMILFGYVLTYKTFRTFSTLSFITGESWDLFYPHGLIWHFSQIWQFSPPRFDILHMAYNSKIKGISSLKLVECIFNISTLLFWIAIVKLFLKNVFNLNEYGILFIYVVLQNSLQSSNLRRNTLYIVTRTTRPNRNILVSCKNYVFSMILIF